MAAVCNVVLSKTKLTAHQLGCIFWHPSTRAVNSCVKNAPEFTGRQLDPWTRVVETGLKVSAALTVRCQLHWANIAWKLALPSVGDNVSGSATGSSSASSSVWGSETDSCSGGSAITPTLSNTTNAQLFHSWTTSWSNFCSGMYQTSSNQLCGHRTAHS